MPRHTTIEALTEAILSVTKCEQYVRACPLYEHDTTEQIAAHLNAYKVMLTRQLDAQVSLEKMRGNDIRFSVIRLADGYVLKNRRTFGGAFNYWFSQSNKQHIAIRTDRQYEP